MPLWSADLNQFASLSDATALAVLAASTLVSEDFACIAAGLLVAHGLLGFPGAVGACFAGIFAGDLLLVLLGRTVGRRSLQAAPLRWWVSAEAVQRAEGWFFRRGPGLILASRFMPGTRVATYVAAGVLRAPLPRFISWFALACALWTPLLVGAAWLMGDSARRVLDSWSNALPALLATGAATWLASRVVTAVATWRGRRLALARWRRLTRWEFWPMWVVYPPVVLYILWLGLRYRGFTLFTATNPGIGAGGGLVGESKSEILRGLAGADTMVARWRLVDSADFSERLTAVHEFMASEGLAYPVVLKPDVGERGAGVTIARDAAAVEAALRAESRPLIVQAYVNGLEFGVFYYRHSTAVRGEIFAITEKRVVAVNGDGKSTIEELILADGRAVCMAPFFLRKFAARLDEVPEKGERVVLTELGTHCRGAMFLDGSALVTPALVHAVERVSRSFDGFYFGRYDVRAESLAAFQAGRFTVIELNGISSEATSIYDPRHSLWFGWRTLCRQWRIAFEIGAANRANGERALGWRETWRLVASRKART